MKNTIEEGFLVFTADGGDAVGTVRSVSENAIIVFVENSGDFELPMNVVHDVHSQKVILNKAALKADFQSAIAHAHDREDPDLVG